LQDSLVEQSSQNNFVPHGHQDVLVALIGQSEHLDRVRIVGSGVDIR